MGVITGQRVNGPLGLIIDVLEEVVGAKEDEGQRYRGTDRQWPSRVPNGAYLIWLGKQETSHRLTWTWHGCLGSESTRGGVVSWAGPGRCK